jgi:heme/copper-type cytochrome/quinol oxidase subunit 2
MRRLVIKLLNRSSLGLIPVAALALAVLIFPSPVPRSSTTHEITLDSRQFEFAPSRIEVNEGDTVIITLHADDVVHGFYLDGYGIQERVTPGTSQRIEFVADRAGTFRYRCSVSCGPMHPFMIGELVVGPRTQFWRAAALTLIIAAGALLWLRQTNSINPERIV